MRRRDTHFSAGRDKRVKRWDRRCTGADVGVTIGGVGSWGLAGDRCTGSG